MVYLHHWYMKQKKDNYLYLLLSIYLSAYVFQVRRIMSGDKTFEEQYDLIVLGTGLVQSLVAGAVALTGRKVIHVDKNDFYGEYYSSHSIENFPIGPRSDKNDNINYQASLTSPTKKNNNENLLYFSQQKLPKLQTYTTKPTHFKRKKLMFQV